jgi:hypothetical protein
MVGGSLKEEATSAFARPIEQHHEDTPGHGPRSQLYAPYLNPMRPGDSRVFRSTSPGTVRVQICRYGKRTGRFYRSRMVDPSNPEAGVRVFRVY